MGLTTNFAFPYPALTDAPDAPSQIEGLAAAVDTSLEDIVTGPSWTTLTLGNGWTGTLQVKLLGIAAGVALRSSGTLVAGTLANGTTLATMSSGFWPAHVQRVAFIITAIGGGSAATGNSPHILIGTDGTLKIEGVSTQVATNGAVCATYWLD